MDMGPTSPFCSQASASQTCAHSRLASQSPENLGIPLHIETYREGQLRQAREHWQPRIHTMPATSPESR